MATSKGYVDSAVSSVLPTEQAGDLIVGSSTAHVANRLAIGSSGQVLKVNSSGNGLEYGDIEALPAIQSGDAGKVLTVSANEAGAEWATASSGGGSDLPLTAVNKLTLSDNVTTINGTAIESSTYDRGRNSLILTGASSIYLPTNNYIDRTMVLGNVPTANSTPVSHTQNSILLRDTFGSTSTSAKPVQDIKNSIVCLFGSIGGNNSNSIVDYNDSIYFGPLNASGRWYATFDHSLVIGQSLQYTFASNMNTTFQGCLIAGNSQLLDIKSSNYLSFSMLGAVGIYDSAANASDRLIVGSGDQSTRHNCFTTGYDSTNGNYIKIGSTMLTETQLQSLLATL